MCQPSYVTHGSEKSRGPSGSTGVHVRLERHGRPTLGGAWLLRLRDGKEYMLFEDLDVPCGRHSTHAKALRQE